jgi:hypothetical protein
VAPEARQDVGAGECGNLVIGCERPATVAISIAANHRYLRALRGFFRPFVFDDAADPAIRKSSAFSPDLIAAVSQRGFNPRPAQVSAGFSGLRYLGATAPRAPRPIGDLDALAPPWKWVRLASFVWSARRSSITLKERTASIRGSTVEAHEYAEPDRRVSD